MTEWVTFVGQRLPELQQKLVEHLILTGISTAVAVAVGLPLGVLILRWALLRSIVLSFANAVQTIPSLAMLAFLLPFFGIGVKPALLALTLYALLPIVRNTYTGLSNLSPAVLGAADGLGFTRWQRLWLVEIPLALPVILAGIRTAAVIGVGIATLSAFIGAGGLGDFINRGLALNNTRLVLLGAVPAALLALFVDFALGLLEDWLKPGRKPMALRWQTAVFASLLVVLFVGGVWANRVGTEAKGKEAGVIRIGTKNFTEQLILGELMAQLIEVHTDLRVERKFNLGGTVICHQALVRGDIDLYPEYTGTALTAILKRETVTDPEEVLRIVRQAYREKFRCEWLEPFGFNNTYAIAVRKQDAQRYGWRKISDLRPMAHKLRAGFTSEFRERPDGYPGLQKAYGFSFGRVVDMDPALMYQALARGKVDVICAFATDGRIPAYDLVTLEDDRLFFPPYHAAPVIRTEVLKSHPVVGDVLRWLAGKLDDETMQQLNYMVDEGKKSPREVARQFLEEQGVLRRVHEVNFNEEEVTQRRYFSPIEIGAHKSRHRLRAKARSMGS